MRGQPGPAPDFGAFAAPQDAPRTLVVVTAPSVDVPTFGSFGKGEVAGFPSSVAAELVQTGVAQLATARDLELYSRRERGINPATHEHHYWHGRHSSRETPQ